MTAPAVDSGQLERVLAPIRRGVVPSRKEAAALADAVAGLVARADAVARDFQAEGRPPFVPLLVGSAAKDTWIHGRVDLDVFLMFAEDLARADLETAGLEAGRRILAKHSLRYAEHPYVHGVWDGYPADVVPAHRVGEATGIKSAVDRTPFHNEWVLARLMQTPALRDEIRLFKAFLQGVDAYGAETSLGAFSGYLTEVLTIHHGGFLPVLRRFASIEDGTRIDPTGGSTAAFPDDALVVIDPVDPGRNAASAVTHERLERARQAARAFLSEPSDRFFAPVPLPPLLPATASRLLRGAGAVVVVFPTPVMREDARVPHLRRAAESLGSRLDRAGFTIEGTGAGLADAATRAWLLVMTAERELPATRRHFGPPLGVRRRAEDFLQKYVDNPLVVAGPDTVETPEGRRLAVTLRETDRDVIARTGLVLRQGVQLGKHVDRALELGPTAILPIEEALAQPDLVVPLSKRLSPVVPWERTGDVAHDYALA